MREQNETESEGELSEDIWPTVLGWCWGLGHDPELALGMMNDRDGLAGGGTDGPTAAQKVDLVIGVDAAAHLERQMQIQQAGVGTGAAHRAAFGLRLGAGGVGGEAGGAADGPVLPGQFTVEEFLGGRVRGDLLVGQQREQAVLEGAEAAFDFAFGLGTGGDEVRDAQRGEGALELGAGIPTVGGGFMAEQGQAIGVQGQWQAVNGEGVAEVLEVVPRGIRRYEGTGQQFAGMIIDREQEGLLVVGRPPLVDRGIMLPEFADAGALPAAARLGDRHGRADQEWEMAAGVGGDGFAVAVEGEAGKQFVSDELVIGRALQWEEGLQEPPHRLWPSGVMVAAGEMEDEGRGVLEPGGPEAEEVSAADAQELGGRVGGQVPAIESVQRMAEEREGEAFGELMFFKVALSAPPARRASLFVSLATLGFLQGWRDGRELSALTGSRSPSLILLPQAVSFCSRPDTPGGKE